MKRILFVASFSLFALMASAQQNILLSPAFWQGKPDMAAIKAEVDKGSNPSQLNAASFDPVVMAINSDAPVDAIKYLLAQPGNEVNKLTHDSRNYIHWASSRGNTAIISYLISKGAKINNEDSHGATPMLFAASGGQKNPQVYDLFIAAGLDLRKSLNADGANALLLGIAGDTDFTLTDYFISKGLTLNSIDADGHNAFSYAAKAGNIEILKKLLQKGIKPSANAMLMAAEGSRRSSNTIEVYRYLESLQLNSAVRGRHGENVLHAIVRKQKQEEIIKHFLAKGVDVNQTDESGNTVLMNAALANRDLTVFDLLLPTVKDINQKNDKGLSALGLAMRSNSPEVVSYLIAKGADAKMLDKAGNNLAYYALESYRPAGLSGQGGRTPGGPKPEDFDIKIKALIAAGLNVQTPQEKNNTLFHYAIEKNDVALLNRVQAMGIDINAKNSDGFSPLHKAALVAKDDALLKHLLSLGAKKDAKTGFDETAFDLAAENETLKKNKVSIDFLK